MEGRREWGRVGRKSEDGDRSKKHFVGNTWEEEARIPCRFTLAHYNATPAQTVAYRPGPAAGDKH